jgi:pimeloyl-ACP methyl ester carboxylesterase
MWLATFALLFAAQSHAQVWGPDFGSNDLPFFAASIDNPGADGALHAGNGSAAEMAFSLGQGWFSLDCNFWDSIQRAELVADVAAANGCGDRGCKLRVFSGSRFLDLQRVQAGATQVRFDETAAVRSVTGSSGMTSFSVIGDSGEVVFFALASGHGPRIEVTNTPLPSDLPPSVQQRSLQLSSDMTLSYLEAGGDDDGDTTFILLHGQPAYSYMFRNALASLGRVGRAIAIDWAGNGYSTPLTAAQFGVDGAASLQSDSELGDLAPTTHSFFEAQATYLDRFVNLLGLTRDGRRIILVIHEVGGLGGFYYAVTHQSAVKGIAFNNTWLDVCPDDLFAQGLCQQRTLAPGPFFGAWAFCVYPSFDCACNQFVKPSFINPAVAQGLVVRPLDSATANAYSAPYGGPTASCPAIYGVIAFPWNITVPTETLGVPEPARALATRDVYDAYHAALRSWDVPKLLLIGAPPPSSPTGKGNSLGIVSSEQIDFARATYPNLTASCTGFSGHLGPEDAPFNFVERIVQWAQANHLLQAR